MALPAGINEQQTRPVAGLIPLPWVMAPALLGAAILGAFVLYAVLKPYSTPPPTPSRAAGGLAWGGTILFTKPQVKSWLRAHGASFPTWKKRHPAGLAIITPKKHRARPHAAKRKHVGGAKRHRAP